MTPTRRTLQYLRNLGFRCAVVEHHNAHTRRRHDLFGFGDVLAIKEGITLLVQVTSGSNLAARRHKILNECPHEAKDWLAAGNEIELHGWRKLAQYRKDGTRAKRDKWEVRLDSITPVDFWEN